MSSLVVIVDAAAADGSPAALLSAPAAISGSPGTILGRLLGQLARYGLSPAAVITRSDWHWMVVPHLPSSVPIMGYLDLGGALAALAAQLAASNGPVVLVHADVVLHDGLLGDLVADPRLGSALVAVSGPSASLGADRKQPARIRVREGKAIEAGSAYHEVHGANAVGAGLLRVARGDLHELIAACWEMSGLVTVNEWSEDLSELLALALVRTAESVSAVESAAYVCDRPREAARAEEITQQLGRISEHGIRLDRVARPDDGFYSTFVVRKISPKLTDLAVRRRWSPNSITLVALVIALAAAECFWRGTTLWLIIGAVLLQVSLVVDCVDGETARYTRRFSPLGAWLDATTDRVKEYAVYAGLALGAARTGEPVWTLAAATLALQVFRNFVDFGFVATIPQREPPPALRVSVGQTDAGPQASAAVKLEGRAVAVMGQGAVALSERTSKTSALKWAKRMVFLPIGERWLIISLAAALSGPRAVFVVLLALGWLSAIYATTGRVLRALAGPAPGPGGGASEGTVLVRRGELDQFADVGPLSRAAATRLPAIPAWIPLGAAAVVALNAALVASPDRRTMTALLVLLTVVVAIPAWRRPVGGRFGWLIPGVVRAIEYALMVRVVAVVDPSAMPATFGLLCAVAYHHYDTVYRWRYTRSGPQESVFRLGLGWDGRLLVFAVLVAITGGLRSPLGGFALLLGALFLVESAAGWRRWLRGAFTRSA